MKYFSLSFFVSWFLLCFSFSVFQCIYGLENYVDLNTEESSKSLDHQLKRIKRPTSGHGKSSPDNELDSLVDSDSFLKELEDEDENQDETAGTRSKSPERSPLPAGKSSPNRRTSSIPRRLAASKEASEEPLNENSVNNPEPSESGTVNDSEDPDETRPQTKTEQEQEDSKPAKLAAERKPSTLRTKTKPSKNPSKSQSPIPAHSNRKTNTGIRAHGNSEAQPPKKANSESESISKGKVEKDGRLCSSTPPIWSLVADSIVDMDSSNGSIYIKKSQSSEASVDACAMYCCAHANCSLAVFSWSSEVFFCCFFTEYLCVQFSSRMSYMYV